MDVENPVFLIGGGFWLHLFAEQIGEYTTYALWASIGLYIGYKLRLYNWLKWPLLGLAMLYIPVDYTPSIETAQKMEEWSAMIQLIIVTVSPFLGFIMPRTENIMKRLLAYGIVIYTFWWAWEVYMWTHTSYEFSKTSVDLLFFFNNPERIPEVYALNANPNEWWASLVQIGLGLLSIPCMWLIWRRERIITATKRVTKIRQARVVDLGEN